MSILRNLRPYIALVSLAALPALAQAAPLKVVDVGAPAINCVFNTKCMISVNDIIGNIPLPGVLGLARLQSRAFVGVAGAPAAGKNGYLYRVDLTQAIGVGNIPCVSNLKLDFGPVSKLPYKPSTAQITGGALVNVPARVPAY